VGNRALDWKARKSIVTPQCKSGGFIGRNNVLPLETSEARAKEESAEAIVPAASVGIKGMLMLPFYKNRDRAYLDKCLAHEAKQQCPN